MSISKRKCEGCQLKQANFGLPAEGKRRWCGGCAKGHAGAVSISGKKCEDCELNQSTFGLPSDGKKRWCSGCAKAHAGAVDSSHKCGGCGLRWCVGCAPRAARAGRRRGQARGSLQKEAEAAGPPLTISSKQFGPLNRCPGPR